MITEWEQGRDAGRAEGSDYQLGVIHANLTKALDHPDPASRLTRVEKLLARMGDELQERGLL